ncbi:hypothetical protein, partial [Desulfosporosinus sp. OT]|uniref:hypothetical protein n=1 Tax=Desulfosporosinus sp. OT TaxID=913865 RepID=UPI000590B804
KSYKLKNANNHYTCPKCNIIPYAVKEKLPYGTKLQTHLKNLLGASSLGCKDTLIESKAISGLSRMVRMKINDR